MSAFTIAFQVPNLVRALFADSALQGAFVPVFTELLEQGKRTRGVPARLEPVLPDLLVLGTVDRAVHRLRRADHVVVRARLHDQPELKDLTVDLSQLMFPIVLLLGLSGLMVGILNSFDHFTCRRWPRSPGTS